MFENVSDGLVIHDPDTGRIRDVNDRYCELTGYSREKLVGSNIRLIVPDGSEYTYEMALERIERAREEGSQLFEFQGKRKDGETFIGAVHLSTVEIGSEERVLASVRDITERKRREQEFEQIFNGVQDAVTVIDPETLEITEANEAYLDLVGYDDFESVREQGVAGLSVTEEGYTVEAGSSVHRRVAETGDPEIVDWQAETKTGEHRMLEVKVAPAVIGGEAVNVAIHRDVTERRRIEHRLRTIAERIEDLIHFVDANTEEVLFANAAYADVFGRSVEEVYSNDLTFSDAIHPDDADAHRAAIEDVIADMRASDPDDSYELSFRIERPDGETRWLESTVYPILGRSTTSMRYVAVTKDVTEQHRRERTLETFHEATRALTAVDSRDDACRRAVRAAEDVLDFPLVSTHLYEDETGRLEPRAVTNRLAGLDIEPPSFGPGDSMVWQVYVEGESATRSEPETAVYGSGVSDPDVVLPLGSHGVMLVGAPTETFDAEDVELAQILAATLEAALNHVAGERELAEREAELRRQRERADQFQRLNTIIRDIEQATVERSSRTDIEEAVCERLIDVGRHDLVWIAESSVGDDELVPRTGAGDGDAYLDGLDARIGTRADSETGTEAGAGAGGHPAVTAYETEAPHTVENVAIGVDAGDWRTQALGHGIQSAIAVPIRYETTCHGILTVESGEPDAFDEATRDVLAELGRSIGYAITVTEREQALESEGTIELEFAVADEGLFVVRGAKAADCRITLERTIRRAGGSFSMLYLVEDADPETVVDRAAAAAGIESAQVVSVDEDGSRGLIDVTAPTWFGSVFTEHGAVVRGANATADGGTLLVETPRETAVRTLVEGFQERYPETELIAKRQRDRTIRSLFELTETLREELTDRQWEALETAYSAGYFEWPREVSGEGVADLLGVSQPTFNKHLRIAERTAFQVLLDRERHDLDTSSRS